MTRPTLVFLHIPKTAGQSIHAALTEIAGSENVSPIRVHTQVPESQTQMPVGYQIYSGHIDWVDLEHLPDHPKAFTVLRDPLERIASFYFYLRRKADLIGPNALTLPENIGMQRAAAWSAEDYFFAGNTMWQAFIRDHYWNPYCSYLVTKRIRGAAQAIHMPSEVLLARAQVAARDLSGLYHTNDLRPLERDLKRWTGKSVSIVDKRVNVGPSDGFRWPKLAALLSKEAVQKLEQMIAVDQRLMHALGFAPAGASYRMVG